MKSITIKMMHPQIRAMGLLMRTILPGYSEKKLRLFSHIMPLLNGTGGYDMKRSFVKIPGNAKNGVRLCIYRPKGKQQKSPGVLWIHGGGYALGSPEPEHFFIRLFVKKFGCTVISPDYCRSPEKPYPAALEDCYAALLWMKAHAQEYSIDSNRLIIAGDSAGGGLTAALSIYARDRGEVAVACQFPIYPMIDDRMITPSSQNNDAPCWNTKSNISAWKLYLGELYGTENVPAYAAPSRLTDFSGLPPAFSYWGTLDMFRDEDKDYMEKLKEAGVHAEYKVFEGCYHAFDLMAPRSVPSKEAIAFLCEKFTYASQHFFARQPTE